MWILYILFGIIGGVFCGLGMGGGTLLMPLISLLGLEQKTCQAINLVSFIVTSSVAIIFHYKNGLIETKNLFEIIVPASVSALFSSVIAGFISNVILKKTFGVFLLLVALWEIVKIIISQKKSKSLKISKKIK